MKTSNDRKNYKKRIATSTHAGMASGVSKYRHVYKSWKRVIAFVLALAMVLGLVYVGGKKKSAKAEDGTISFGEGKAVTQTTEASLTDDSFANTLETLTTETTIRVPLKTLSFTVSSKHNLNTETYECTAWTAGALVEGWAPEVDATNGDITNINLSDEISVIDCGEDKSVYFHKFNIVKNEASEWVLDAASVSSVKFNFVYEAPTAPAVSKTDFTYTVSDVTAPENTIYYGSYGYSAESVADTTTELAGFDDTITASSDAATVSSTLSAEGNDGTYIITKKITTSAGDLIYGWQGLFVRDDEIDGADSCDIAFTDSDDAAITALDSLDPTKKVTYHVVNGSSETVSCKLTVTDTATSDTVIEKSGASMAASAELTDSFGDSLETVHDRSGKTWEFKAVFSKDGKKDKVVTKTITYVDVVPTVTLSSIDTTTIDVDGTSYIKDKDGNAVVYMNYSAAGTAGAAKISSSGVTVTPSSTCTVDVDTFADQTSVIDSKITISDAPEGKVDFSVQLENSLGVSAETPATFELNFDKEAPKITLIEVSQGSIAYNTPATSDVTLAAEDYKFTSSQEIKFVFTVSDAYSGVNSAKFTLDGVDYAGTELEPGKYAVEIPADTTLTLRGTTHTATITADDKVGWASTPLNVEFTYIPDKVEVTKAAIESRTNNTATVGSETFYDGDVNLVYTIESDVALNKDSISLTANYNGTPDTDIKAKAKSVSLEPTGNANEYKVTIELAEENSVKFDNINFKIANNNKFYSDVKTISILKIDMTDPEAVVEGAVYVDPEKSIDGEDGWYNTLYLKITYEDPTENGVKSGIESVTVTQDTGKEKTTTDIEVDESKGYKIVKIEDSVSIAGTKVKITAEDKLKHTFETGELTYYVDSAFDGEVGLSVESDGNTISDPADCVKGDPVITASANDTVGVKDYSIKVTQNGTDVAAYSIPDLSGIKDGTTVNLEDVLTADGKTLDDGEYKINATAKDIAGNTKNASEVSFTLDCNAPAVEDIKLEQTNSADQTISIKDKDGSFTSSVSRRFDLNFTVSGLSDVNLDPAAGKGSIAVTGPNGDITSTYDSSAKTLQFTVSAADMETIDPGTKKFTITASDAAGNETERIVKVKLLEDKVVVSYAIKNGFAGDEEEQNEIIDADGDVVLADKKQEAEIVFTIKSDSKVTASNLSLKVNGVDEAIDDSRFTVDTEEDGNCVYTYPISINGINEKKTFELSAVNNYGVSGKNNLTALGFDLSDPTRYTAESTQTKHGNDDWYKNLVLVVYYDDSDGLAWYSGIASINISGASVKTNQQGVSDFKLDDYIAAHPDKGHFLVDVEESTVSGNEILATNVKISVKDNVGRGKILNESYKVDKTRPNPVSYQVEVNGNSILETPATKRIFGKEATDAVITYSMEDNIRLRVNDPFIVVNGPNGITASYKKSRNMKAVSETVKLSDLVELTDGKYNIVFTSEDLAGNNAKFDISGKEKWSPYSTNIWLDYTSPTLSKVTVTQVGNDAIQETETGYRQLTTASTSESKGEFTLKFNTKDPVTNGYSSKIKTVEIKEEYSDGSETNYYLDDTEITKYKHEFKIQSDERYIGKTVKYTITVVDGAGNSTSKTFYLSFTTDEIAVTSQLSGLTTDNGTKNNTFDIIYQIKSAAPITKNDKAEVLNTDNITLAMKSLDGNLNKDTAGSGVLKLADTYDAENSVYDYIYTYTVNRLDSDQLTDITMSVKNNNGVVSKEDKISLVNIDLRNPYMDLPDGFETEWYQKLPLVFNYGDDEQREYVSGVAAIKITGVKQALGEFFNKEFDERVTNGSIGVDVKESESLAGTPVTVEISDNFGRSYTKSYVFHVDETDPDAVFTVNDRSASDVNGAYLGGEIANPTVAYQVSDNIQVQEYSVVITLPSGATVTPASGNATNNISNSTTLAALIGAENCEGGVPKDGKYTITVSVKDIAGRTPTGGNVSATFVVDNTVPLNDLVITTEKPAKFDKFKNSYSNATTNTAYEYGQYYGSDVYFNAVVVEDNVSEFTVTDNGAVIYTGTEAGTFNVGVSSEGEHSIAINTVDKTGLKSEQQVLNFVIDKTPPDVSAALNGSGFAEGGALRYLNSNGDVSVAVSDANVDDDDLTMTVTTTPPNSGGSTSESKVQPGSQVFAQDGEYTVKFVAIDKAGNKSAERSVEFRVDKTPPELKFSGAPDKGTATSSVTMNYIVNEAYYSDMNGCTLRVYKKIDGQGESLLKTVEIKPTGPQYSLSELFQDEGEYRFEMAAEDKCGNKAQASYTFILDGKAPIITLTGVGNYDKTVEDVILGITVDETFFASNKVILTGTRIDIDGEKHKVDFNDFNPNAGKVTTFEQLFKEDGIYDISIESTDKAGNKSSKQLHFTIDRTDPEINGVDDYAGKAVQGFDWNVDADNMVRDLTVCNTSVYMDGVEYDGKTSLKDGTHLLRVVATDELGHTTEKEVSFKLDTTAPNILVSGVEEGQYIKVPTDVKVTVELDEDTLTKATLNGQDIPVNNGVASVRVDSRMAYTLTAEAVDEAGNVSKLEMHFNFGEKFPWWIFLAGAGGVGLIGLVIGFSRKKQKKK